MPPGGLLDRVLAPDEIIADVKLVLKQTDDAVRFAEDTPIAERHTPGNNREACG